MRLAFRRRLFFGLLALGTLPLAAALTALALYVRSTGSLAGPRAAIDEIALSGSRMVVTLDTSALDDPSRAAVRDHVETVVRGTTLARRAETLSRSAAAALGGALLLAALLLVALSIYLVRRWSAQVSAPIEELVAWVRGIQRGEPPPAPAAPPALRPSPTAAALDDGWGPPELATLRQALRQMWVALEEAREQEVERERLRVFRETARRVAHEMRGPLNATQLALRRLAPLEGNDRHTTAVAVLAEETERLRHLADEFAIFGRLPEGPETVIDLAELVEGVLEATVPADCPVARSLAPGLAVRGRYEMLRRAVENVVRNAVEATDARGIAVRAAAHERTVRVTVADHGSGVPPEERQRIFQPYVTTKQRGTGLGLTIAHQAVTAQGGTLTVESTPEGGAAFIFVLPLA